MTIIKLPCFKIEVTKHDSGVGYISSNLKEEGEYRYNIAIDAIESIILGHALAGVAIESPAYIEGIETAVNACAQNIID